MLDSASRPRAAWWTSLALALLTLGVYFPVFDNGFVNFDDDKYVSENLHVQSGLTLDSLSWAFTTYECHNWHPLTWMSHMLDYDLYGLHPAGHHATNVALHILNTVALFLLLRRMTGAQWRSAFVAALFAVHPLHVESVAWVAERKDVLSTFFWMLTIGAYVWYSEKPSLARYSVVVLLFVLDLMAKPMVVTLPLVLLLLDFWPLRRTPSAIRFLGKEIPIVETADGTGRLSLPWNRLMIEKLPLLALSAVSSIVTVQAQGEVVGSLGCPFQYRAANTVLSYVRYIKKTVWPTKLVVLYPFPRVFALVNLFIAAGILICVTVLVVRHAQKRPYLFTGWFWYLGTLMPVIGLVQVGLQAIADRYMYIPSIGLFILLAWGGYDLATQWRWKPVIAGSLAVLALAACIPITVIQLGYWKNSDILFEHTLRWTADNFTAENNLGVALFSRNDFEGASKHFAEAVKINPYDTEAHLSLAVSSVKLEKFPLAAEHLKIVLQQTPGNWKAQGILGLVLLQQGKPEEALPYFIEAIRLNPSDSELHTRLATALQQSGRSREAVSEYREALKLSPQRLDVLNNLAWLLASSPDAEIRNGKEAVQLAEEACRLTGYRTPVMVGTLGVAYAEDGRFDDAVEMARKAVSLAETAGNTELVEKNKKMMELFIARKPFHETTVSSTNSVPQNP